MPQTIKINTLYYSKALIAQAIESFTYKPISQTEVGEHHLVLRFDTPFSITANEFGNHLTAMLKTQQ